MKKIRFRKNWACKKYAEKKCNAELYNINVNNITNDPRKKDKRIPNFVAGNRRSSKNLWLVPWDDYRYSLIQELQVVLYLFCEGEINLNDVKIICKKWKILIESYASLINPSSTKEKKLFKALKLYIKPSQDCKAECDEVLPFLDAMLLALMDS